MHHSDLHKEVKASCAREMVFAKCGNRYSTALGQWIVLTYLTLARANHGATRNLRGSLVGEATCLRKLVGFSVLFY
jgi:hypothetical protein